MFTPEEFPRSPMRRRLLVALLAVATAAGVTWAMTRKSGLVRNANLVPHDVAPCTAGQTGACVGSSTTVIVAPASAPAAR
jgi:hypothetical protein